jgi:hypothetical protein
VGGEITLIAAAGIARGRDPLAAPFAITTIGTSHVAELVLPNKVSPRITRINADKRGLKFIRVHPCSSVVKIRPVDQPVPAARATFNPNKHGSRISQMVLSA